MQSLVTVITPAASYDLTTVEAVRIILGRPTLTPEEELRIQGLITAGSTLISNYCGRVFPAETVSEIFWGDPDALNPRGGADWPREFWGAGYAGVRGEKLNVERYPIISISSITVDNEPVLNPSDYRIDYRTGFIYRLDESGYIWTWIFGKSITVEYIGGYDPIPADLARAASLYCVDSLSSDAKDTLIKSETVYGIGSTTYFDNNQTSSSGNLPVGDLSAGVMGMLGLYKRYL